MFLRFLIFITSFGAIVLLSLEAVPFFVSKYHRVQENKIARTARELEDMFILGFRKRWLFFVFTFSPLILGLLGYLIFKISLAAVLGAALGFVIPTLIVRHLERVRKRKFAHQLRDTILMLASSLKVGLSLLQAIEVVVEEMPPPTSQEFGLLLKENHMGVSLEDSFKSLIKRMSSEDLNLLAMAILVARETGGSLPDVLEKLASTIKEKRKIQDKLVTLTTQARWQGIIISILPLVFAVFEYQQDPRLLQIMLSSELGKAALIYAGISEIIGMLLIRRLSKMENV